MTPYDLYMIYDHHIGYSKHTVFKFLSAFDTLTTTRLGCIYGMAEQRLTMSLC